MILKDPSSKMNKKIKVVAWLYRRAMFYDIDQVN